jgi:ABC-type lipoprotein export system ATPase subunit
MINNLIKYIKNTTNYDDSFYSLIRIIIFRCIIFQMYTILSFDLLSKNTFSFFTSFLFVITGALGLLFINKIMNTQIIDTKNKYLNRQYDILINKIFNGDLNYLKIMDKSLLTSTFLKLEIIYTSVVEFIIMVIILASTIIFSSIYYLYTFQINIIFSIIVYCFGVYYGMRLFNYAIKDAMLTKNDINNNFNVDTSEYTQDFFNIVINKDIISLNNMKGISNKMVEVNCICEINMFYISYFLLFFMNIVYYLPHIFISSNASIFIVLINLNRNIIWYIEDLVVSQNKIISLITTINTINEIYDMTTRKEFDQIDITNCKTLNIRDFNLDTYIKLKSDNLLLDLNTFYLVRGKSGSGKSTFIKIMRNIQNTDNILQYDLFIDNEIIKDGFKQLNNNIYYVDQFGKLMRSGTLIDIITGFNPLYQTETDLIKINELINITGLDHLNDIDKNKDNIIDPKNKLSGGEQYRLNICRTLFLCEKTNKKIILMDEIDAGLDSEISEKIVKYMINNYKNMMILFITHDSNLDKLNIPTLKFESGLISII